MVHIKISKVIAAACSLTVFVLFLEFLCGFLPSSRLSTALRFFNYEGTPTTRYRPSELTGYELIPRSCPEVNSLGMFDREYPLKKDSGTYRILVLGDSITAPNIYPEILESRLNQVRPGGRVFEVLNAALPGINIRQYARYLSGKGIYLSPDMVFIGLCIADFELWSPIVYAAGGNLLEYQNPFPLVSRYWMSRFLFRHSAFYRVLMVRIEKAFYQRSRQRPGIVDEEKREGEYYLARIKRTCQRHHATLCCVIFPYLKPLEEYSESERRQYQIMRDVLKGLGIDFFDLHEAFRGADLYALRTEPDDWVHLNSMGQERAAQAIFEHLTTDYF